jgi:hypothetical protein
VGHARYRAKVDQLMCLLGSITSSIGRASWQSFVVPGDFLAGLEGLELEGFRRQWRNHLGGEPFMLHLFAALAEKERAIIGHRTKAALSAAKARGQRLGNPNLATARKAAGAALRANADNHAANVLPIIAQIQKAGATTLRAIAEALNARGIQTPRGRRWEAMSVKNALARAA